MRTPTHARYKNFAHLFALTSATALLLTACGSGGSSGTGAQGVAAANDKIPTTDVISAIRKDDAAARLLPSGTTGLTVAVTVGGTPPGTAYLPDSKTLTGQDVDFTKAVAKVLGIRLKIEQASFEAILPALDSGKYDFGAANFGVTDERRKTIDFVTYINDGQGFATRADSKLSKITDLRQLCGLNVATAVGEKAYTVQTYGEQSAIWSSVQQGLKFLNEYHRLDVGFAFKKGTELAPAFQSAVNRLIADGTYTKILKKWGTTASAIPKSQISPPELKN
ncbi:transporter substrate-binding domain-containing protein [Streptomyces sp. NPDC090075]|uniref:transporter substrate-binding domain-containing protein n=1 Tax=Streptomyces sp. NPDC090075 TaxID=3365937 RepID=UPI00381437D3